MKEYYVSLCRELVGYYVKFLAPSEEIVREHCVMYFGKLWCYVYTNDTTIKEYNGVVINENDPIRLVVPEWE